MARTLDLLTDEVVHRRAGLANSIEALATKLLLDTARAVTNLSATDAQSTPACTHTDAAVHTAERYLRDNYSRPIGVRDVAAQVHLSERHISRLFAKSTGMSVMDYLTKVRIDTAAQLLLSQQLPIKQAAAHVGYPDVRYFTTLFRRRMGMTPGEFRQSGGTTFHRAKRHEGA
jgi:AraC family L-rhamnose operon transcriptional activator RhaR